MRLKTFLTAAVLLLSGAVALPQAGQALPAAPLSVDNFEGLGVRQDSSGTTLLYLLSDDNGCSKQAGVIPPRFQRTLLLLFELTD